MLFRSWKEPRAAQVCPTGAIRAVQAEDSEMRQIVKDEALSALNPAYDTKPRVWYKNLHRYTDAFVGGTVARDANGVVDCVAGAKVCLAKDGKTVAEAVTDAFGDFKFDRIPENSGTYTLEIDAGDMRKSLEIAVTGSVYAGTIQIGRAHV